MSNPEKIKSSPENMHEQGGSSLERGKLEEELAQVNSEIKALEKERDGLREAFTQANDAEYAARLKYQTEKSAHPESYDLRILEDAQKANKALADMYQRKLDEWSNEGGTKYYQLQQRKQDLESQMRNLAS